MEATDSIMHLIIEAKTRGVPTDSGSLLVMKEIFANAESSELRLIANDEKYKDVFFFLLQKVWNIWDVIAFYNLNCNKELIELRKAKEESEEDKEDWSYIEGRLKAKIESTEKKLLDANERLDRANEQIKELSRNLDDAQYNIIKLKARLYDTMEGI